jgi:acetyl-CoA carboxylase biotin carboxyl carrier protein
MTIDEIRKLIDVVRETGISELEVQLGENRVRIRTSAPTNQEIVLPQMLPIAVTSSPAQVAQQTVPAAASPETLAAERAAIQKDDERNVLVKSPIVGTYYDAPTPGAPPFIRVGDRVEPKQVLCIIESMKLMNEIEAEIAGVVVAKHVENGRPVEYGELLFTLRPA